MQYQKRNLLTIALASALAIAFASGCDDKPTSTTGTNGGTTPQTQTEAYYEWHKVAPADAKFTDTQILDALGSGGNLYVGTDTEGLVVFDGGDEKKATQFKAAALAGTLPGGGAKALAGTNKVRNLVELDSKKVAFVSDATGIGIVNNKTIEAAWTVGANNVPAGNVTTLLVAESAPGTKWLIAGAPSAGNTAITYQALSGLTANWVNGVKDTAGAEFTKAVESLGLDDAGNLLFGQALHGANTQGFFQINKANIGVAGNHVTTARTAHADYLEEDTAQWPASTAPKHIVTLGNVAFVALPAKLVRITDYKAAVTATTVDTVAVHRLVKDGANGLWAYTETKGIVYFKKDGSVEATKGFDGTLKTGFDLEAGKTTDYTFPSKNIINKIVIGKKTYYATKDHGLIVGEEKSRPKK